jgi:hypothetical protein
MKTFKMVVDVEVIVMFVKMVIDEMVVEEMVVAM